MDKIVGEDGLLVLDGITKAVVVLTALVAAINEIKAAIAEQ